MEKLAVGIPEAAEMIGVGRSSIYVLFRDGKLTRRKCGQRSLSVVEELRRYVDSLPVGNGGE